MDKLTDLINCVAREHAIEHGRKHPDKDDVDFALAEFKRVMAQEQPHCTCIPDGDGVHVINRRIAHS